MAQHSIERLLIDGVWTTVDVEEGGGDSALHGFAVHWSNGSGWDVAADGFRWSSTDFAYTLDWDTDGYNEVDNEPFWVPAPPAGVGGIYLLFSQFVFRADADAGFVGANIAGSSRGNVWAPCLNALGDNQILTCINVLNLGDEDGTADITSLINFSAENVKVFRVDYNAIRLGPQP